MKEPAAAVAGMINTVSQQIARINAMIGLACRMVG
jgi:hypothetical protein